MNAQKAMQEFMNELVGNGTERGVQFVAYHKGKVVADVCAGADIATDKPIRPDTLFPVYSATKGLTATLAHLLAERGDLDYDMTIASVWPEFTANGKADITLRQAMSHAAGLPDMPAGLTHDDMLDWDKTCSAIAQLTPVWPPGTRQAYHPFTYGWLVGEVLRRIDGRGVGRQLQDDVCRRLGIADEMFIGITDSAEPRVAHMEVRMSDGPDPKAGDHAGRGGNGNDWVNQTVFRHACMPAANGILSARALAKHYAALLPGGVNGVELLPQARLRIATQLQKPSEPLADDAPRRGLGYELWGAAPAGNGVRPFGHDSFSGAFGFADPVDEMAVGFTRNYRTRTNCFHVEMIRRLREAISLPTDRIVSRLRATCTA